MSNRYQKSESLLKRALKTIPLASQTFSKSLTQFPVGVSPLFIKRGQGSHVWDVDGNEYIDFINALASVTLGYNDPDVFIIYRFGAPSFSLIPQLADFFNRWCSNDGFGLFAI